MDATEAVGKGLNPRHDIFVIPAMPGLALAPLFDLCSAPRLPGCPNGVEMAVIHRKKSILQCCCNLSGAGQKELKP